MNGTDSRYLLDTNIFIYYFNGDPVVQPIVEDILSGNISGFYCPVSWVELLCYPALTEEEAEQIRAFLRSLTCVALAESILDQAAQIRRDYRTALPDALIAACALAMTSTLVTRNIQDFQQIHGLSIVNPFNP